MSIFFAVSVLAAAVSPSPVVIPAVPLAAPRSISVEDIAGQRHGDALSVAPDGKHFAILVRQAVPGENQYRSRWFIGDIDTGHLNAAGDGGDVDSATLESGWVSGREARWSPDGRWFAYRMLRNGEMQLWLGSADGSEAKQLTYNTANVIDFVWSLDSKRVYFIVAKPRAQLDAAQLSKERQGYQYDEDLSTFTDLMRRFSRSNEPAPGAWTITLEGIETRGSDGDLTKYNSLRNAIPPEVYPASQWTQDNALSRCGLAAANELLCVRTTQTRPAHVVLVDKRANKTRTVVDLNPEFINIRFGKVESIEWNVPDYPWNQPGNRLAGVAPKKVTGYIIYPPNFDRHKKYPVIISPYVATGFDHGSRWEQPLQAYAAAGFVVLNLNFPFENETVMKRLGKDLMKELYNPKLGFPHLALYADSTLKALDLVARRGFIDTERVGIGGTSNGTFIPLYMMQHTDRIAAASISSPSWGEFQYYWQTGSARARYEETTSPFLPKPGDSSSPFYRAIDIAENVDQIEGPILMNLADSEIYAMLRLIRHMADNGRPYDAWVYLNEGHTKTQPAHLYSIMARNFDWFRFWLQDREDPDPAKAAQYARWHALRKLQCKNPRSLRDYCEGRSIGVSEE